MIKNRPISTKRIVLTALMAALTVAGSAIRITVPVELTGTTAFHLGNIMCSLSGILLGPWLGGLAAGLGSFLYDMTNPLYISDAWITFLTKGLYGLIPGLTMLLWKENWGCIKAGIASAAGAITYAVIYLLKTCYYDGMFKQGLAFPAAVLAATAKIPATVFNAVVAIVCAPILAVAIRKALEQNRLTLN